MKRMEIAPGVFASEIAGEKFKRCKIAVHLVVPGRRENATALALLPHVLDRRCAAIPDPTQLSRKLFSLYGAELTSESYTAGANRVITFGMGGLKNEYALEGEDLAAEYLQLLCNLLFAPQLENGVFVQQDVQIEKEKQADFLRSEMNDKRGHCLRQARRKLYGASPIGIESAGYLEDIESIDAKGLYAEYRALMETAHIEVQLCGISAEKAADALRAGLSGVARRPLSPAVAVPLAAGGACQAYTEPMATVQGKLCIVCTSGRQYDAKGDVVMRLASAMYGGLPTSRLFVNVREKKSLCYYCASSFGYFGGTLTIDSGVDHDKAQLAAAALREELEKMQAQEAGAEELDAAKKYLFSAFSSAKDSPDALMNWAFVEWLKGTNRTLDEVLSQMQAVTTADVKEALSAFAPAVEYVITEKPAG